MPGYWMNEGGQSSTGQVRTTKIDPPPFDAQYLAQLIHFITTTHPAYAGLLKTAEEENSNPHEGPQRVLSRMTYGAAPEHFRAQS